MRTSATQYDLMVTYMEQHGDLNKFSGQACGKLETHRRWNELIELLNSDSTGDAKPLDKWKKVWSDFKNNTKKKAAKLHRAATGTGGGPAMHAKLSNLEERVLNIIGVQAATGIIGISEAGFTQVPAQSPDIHQPGLNQPELSVLSGTGGVTIEALQPVQSSTPEARIEEFVVEELPPIAEQGNSTPRRPQAVHTEPVPSPAGHTPRRNSGRRRLRQVPQRRSHLDEAAQSFLNSDEEWRRLRIEQHQNWMELKREQLRVRELELATQNGWQVLAKEALDLIKEYIKK